ncbi:MAG: hypothetical protein ACPG6N_07830, partial [Flavobacteriales bacterium]
MIGTKIQGFWHSTRAGFVLAMLAMSWGVQAQNAWTVETPLFDKAVAEMEVQTEETGRDMVGLVLPTHFDVFEHATRSVEGNFEVWTLTVQAPGALATCLYFDDFHVPAGARLWFETPQGRYSETWVEGPVTSFENNDHRRWTNNEVPGDALVLIYEAPVGLTEAAALGVCGV